MDHRLATMMGAVLLISGCATTAPQTAIPWTLGPHGTVDERMNEIAVRFEDDRRNGGTAYVIKDVEGCYFHVMRQTAVDVYELRDCLILDYTAYNTDQVDGRQENGALSPFFGDDVSIARWSRYGVLAQFKDGTSEIAYLKDSHQLVQRYLLRELDQIYRRPQQER